jgi:carboxypeptidase Q
VACRLVAPLPQSDCLGKPPRYADAMKSLLLGLAALPALALAEPAATDPAGLRDLALKDDTAWQIVEVLTTEIGPRLAGTDAEARARDWAVARLKSLGFSNVRVDPFEIDGWERGVERGEIVAPFPQPLVLTALGGSGATPASGVTREVIGFGSVAELEAASPAAIRDKIVFVWHRMGATQDASSYAAFGAVRQKAPAIAAAKGAAAIVVRSVGTGNHRLAHAGATFWNDGQKPIPAAALSVPDAEQLERILAKGQPVRLKLVLTPRFTGRRPSGNVIAEIPGRNPDAGIVLVSGHLDSWDLGTGAIDDGVGIAIMTAAARLVAQAGQPLRTIRLVWFGTEETGSQGGDDYFRKHGGEKHVMAAESDFGADRPWRFETRVADASAPALKSIDTLLQPLGITRGSNESMGGSDVRSLADAGVPAVSIRQDGMRYFDIHHTADDTLDKVDSAQLRQNVAAWTALLAVAANAVDWPEKAVIRSKTSPK